MLGIGHDVQGKGGVGQAPAGSIAAQQAIFQHEPRAVEAFFTRLEHETDLALQRFAPRAQQPRCPGQHRGVSVVAAGVHRAGNRRGERQPRLLRHWQGIHIAAQQHAAATIFRIGSCAALQRRDQSGGRGTFGPLKRQIGERGADFVAGFGGLQPQFRLSMDRAA